MRTSASVWATSLALGCGTVGVLEFEIEPAGPSDQAPCSRPLAVDTPEGACWRDEVWMPTEDVELRRRTIYDPVHGRIVRIENDGVVGADGVGRSADGRVDHIVQFAWSDDGRALVGRVDTFTNLGKVDGWCEVRTPDGRLQEHWVTQSEEGAWVPALRQRWEGSVLAESCVEPACDVRTITTMVEGRPRFTRRFESGTLTEEAEWLWDVSSAGARYQREVVYPELGAREWGAVDADGRVVAVSKALDTMAPFDVVTRHRYDTQGRVVEELVEERGEVTQRLRWWYEDDGSVVSDDAFQLTGADGEPFAWSITVRESGPTGQETRIWARQLTLGGVMVEQMETRVEYDEGGVPASQVSRSDLDGNGRWETVETYEWPPVTCR